MISDDIIYVGLLLVSIAFGKITRQIPNTPVRKWTSSLFGLGEVFFRSLLGDVIFRTIVSYYLIF